VAARVFDSNAVALGTEFIVNTYTTSNQFAPHVSTDDFDNFVVVWASLRQDGDSIGVFGRVIDADGVPVTDEFPVNQSVVGVQRAPDVTPAPGGFLVAWEGDQDVGDSGVFGRFFATPAVVGGICGDANGSQDINATDALVALRTGVGTAMCDVCLCDVDRSGAVVATDALLILQSGVGQPVVLDCVAC